MKTSVMTSGLGLGLWWAAAAAALAVPVTFQVDLSAQKALGAFDPAIDTVLAAGSFNGWSTSDFVLSPSATDPNIYVGTIDDVTDAVGATVQYKFILSTAAGTTWEGNVGAGGGTGNRTFALSETAQTLPVVFFNNVTNSTVVTSAITFQVNLSYQIAQGNFDPDAGTAYVAGDFNSWSATSSPLTRSASNGDLWAGTYTLTGAVGSAFSYKFVLNGSTWENNNVGPNGAQNRAGTLQTAEQTLSPVYFSNLSNAPTPIVLLFEVDLSAQVALGNFDVAQNTVEARGSFDTWGSGVALTNNPPAEAYLYRGAYTDVNDSPGVAVAYQFVLNGTTWETAVGNRLFTLTGTNDQVFPRAYFNNVGDLGKISWGPVVGGQTTVTWTAAPGVRLQSATTLQPSQWQDVANTKGQGSAQLKLGSGELYLRLVGP